MFDLICSGLSGMLMMFFAGMATYRGIEERVWTTRKGKLICGVILLGVFCAFGNLAVAGSALLELAAKATQ